MKTALSIVDGGAVPIVRLLGGMSATDATRQLGRSDAADASGATRRADATSGSGAPRPSGATSGSDEPHPPTAARALGERVEIGEVARARAFAEPLVGASTLPNGEFVLAHADGVAALLAGIGASPELCAAAYLVPAAERLDDAEAVLAPLFGASQAALAAHARKLGELRRAARGAVVAAAERARQLERVRKMLLAFSRDLRVVLFHLASRLQTLRFHAASKRDCPPEIADEALHVLAPLANRLGLGQLKWELEDLSFRFLDGASYRRIAELLDERRVDRETRVERLRAELAADLAAHGLIAEVQGRPKHLYSIWKKMQKKRLDFTQVQDVVALRVIVADVVACYAVLGRIHERFGVVAGELDDYIARPKANGYRSLHTVVEADAGQLAGVSVTGNAAGGAAAAGRLAGVSMIGNAGGGAAAAGRSVEIQIRTPEMHRHAEYGFSAHWAYKESAGTGTTATGAGAFEAQIAEARMVVLRQLFAWERDLADDEGLGRDPDVAGNGNGESAGKGIAASSAAPLFADRIYVLTPAAAIVELGEGATPIDFAYAVHTELGHRCRGAKVEGRVVPLNTRLHSGQKVEITATKTGGPSLDWLNPELGFLNSPRARAKVRSWFNAEQQQATIARGREAVERLLQRHGRTALKHAELAGQLGLASADALFEVVGKDELSLRTIEALLKPAPAARDEPAPIALRPARARDAGGVLVVGIDSLLTTLARCCRPVPPDAIAGYVTRGRGVGVHRAACTNLRELMRRAPERVIAVAWAASDPARPVFYPVDVGIEASDRPALLRDVSEVFAKERVNVTGVRSQSVRDGGTGTAFMTFTIEVADTARLDAALGQVRRVAGVRSARRR